MKTTIYTVNNNLKPDGSFTMADSNSFLSPYEILPVAQEKQIFRDISGKFLFHI